MIKRHDIRPRRRKGAIGDARPADDDLEDDEQVLEAE
jgi:hypothetical protein